MRRLSWQERSSSPIATRAEEKPRSWIEREYLQSGYSACVYPPELIITRFHADIVMRMFWYEHVWLIALFDVDIVMRMFFQLFDEVDLLVPTREGRSRTPPIQIGVSNIGQHKDRVNLIICSWNRSTNWIYVVLSRVWTLSGLWAEVFWYTVQQQ